MTRDTQDLIARLATGVRPVRRLQAPWQRTLLWFGLALPYAAIVATMHGAALPVESTARFVVEQGAALATSFAATLAAFASIVPGYNKRVLLLPAVPLALWIASIGYGCVQDWMQHGPEGLAIRPDWDCLQPAAMLGLVPALALVPMLRKGAALQPRITVALAGLAVAGIANFGLQIFHARDASIMVLVWHIGGAAVLATLGSIFGRRLLPWRSSLT